MKVLNKKYDICLEIVTPLSIGAGSEKDWTKGLDYVEKNDNIYILNLPKMINAGIDVAKLTSCIEQKDSKALLQLVGSKLADVSEKVLKRPVSSSQDIKSFVKNQLTGCPIIPGSSIKGAIRSILFNYLRNDEVKEQDVFGSSTKGDEFMRFIKLSDVDFDDTELVNTKVYNLDKNGTQWTGGWKHAFMEGNTDSHFKSVGFNTIYESLVPSQIGYGSLMLGDTVFDMYGSENQKYGGKKKELFDISYLFHVINNHTRNYLNKEKAFFLKYPAEKSDEIVRSIDGLLQQIPEDDSCCMFKMAAGSGFHSITGDWQFDDYCSGTLDRKRNKGNNVKPKSRKIAIYKGEQFMLMGFVKLSLLEPEEANKIAMEKEQAFKERLKESKTLEERRKKEQEERERLERLNRQQQQECVNLIALAHKLFEENNYEEALALLNQVVTTIPTYRMSLQNFIKEVETKLNFQKRELEAKEAQKRVDEITKAQYMMPLAEKISKANKLPTLFGNIKAWMKQNERESLTEDELSSVKKKVFEIYSSMKSKDQSEWKTKSQKWKDLSDRVGQNVVEQWLVEL